MGRGGVGGGLPALSRGILDDESETVGVGMWLQCSHCRYCGKVFCGKCSDKVVDFPNGEKDQVGIEEKCEL